jgi:uncharacterized protein
MMTSVSEAPAWRDRRFRVLSLDGGGIRGVFSASVLSAVEEQQGIRVADYFDLIIGTSTGGIIALGLGMGLSAREILTFYTKNGPRIFPTTFFHQRVGGFVRHLAWHKYSAEPLKNALEEVFGDRLLGESQRRLVITSFDAVAGDVHLFKTSHHPKFTRDYQEKVVDVALATSAAPTYLPGHHPGDGRRFIDGGVWGNCPAPLGILEAMTVLGAPRESVEVLSIGTTESPFSVGKLASRLGLLPGGSGAVRLLMEAQAKAAVAQANLLTDHDRMLRISPVTNATSLDDCRQIRDLTGLGAHAARHHLPKISSRFLDAPAGPFQPYRTV